MRSLLMDAFRRQNAQNEGPRTLVSNLAYEGQEKTKQPNHGYPSNAIKTTKYTLLNFIPKNLYEQFQRWANFYFLGIVVLNFIPQINAFQPYVAMIPLCVILALTALKDAWEDFRRYQSDKKLNNTPCLIYRKKEKQFVECRWKDVKVGDFVKVECNEIVPADLLLLHTSDPNGICHIATANLDGETNLKQRIAVPGVCVLNPEFHPERFKSTVVCEQPNDNLKHFNCHVELPDKEVVGAGIDNLLMRGCTVRNTDHAAGFVVYTGHETKAMLNNNKSRYKHSKLEKQLNCDVIYCIILLFVMCLVGSLGHFFWLEAVPGVPPYLAFDNSSHLDSSSVSSFLMFFTMIILLQIMIPISLYLSIELVKIGQIFFISNDIDLYDEETNSCVQCKSLKITEDLGQIEYVFSDKTGTLTENKMVFKRCTIMGNEYAHEENAIRLDGYDSDELDSDEEIFFDSHLQSRQTDTSPEDNQHHTDTHRSQVTGNTRSTVAFSSPLETEVIPDQKLLRQIRRAQDRSSGNADLHLDFFVALAICNTVVVSMATSHRQRAFQSQSSTQPDSGLDPLSALANRVSSLYHNFTSRNLSSTSNDTLSEDFVIDEDHDPQSVNMENYANSNGPHREQPVAASETLCYEAESPDEAALVYAAKAYGFVLMARTHNSVTVRLPSGEEMMFEVLDILGFDFNRKRMSVLVKHPVTQENVLYTKGADNVIMELLGSPYAERLGKKEWNFVIKTQKHLDQYAKDGLRTLCFTKKIVSDSEYKSWLVKRKEALAAIDQREQQIADSAVQLETNLSLLGATGVEDHLQESVPDTIAALREAGVHVWVLTGDKEETMENIGFACGLLEDDDLLIHLSGTDKESCKSSLDCAQQLVKMYQKDPRNVDTTQNISLLIDGQALNVVLSPDLLPCFVEVTKDCRSVICSRVTPLQKSTVVEVMQKELGVMTLAVGDGANDVNMIQTANVGIGISGPEGMQAVMASDFSIPRFKHLKKLLLVHGHWCYSRLANMIIYFFYKNVAYVNLLFWYQFFCGFSGTAMIDYWLMIFFNLFFTSVPPIMFGIMDRDVCPEILLGVPELYRTGQEGQEYNRTTFWVAILDAFYQSLVCFFVPYWVYQDSDVDMFTFGTPLNTASFFTIMLHLSIEIKAWTVVHWAVMLGSVACYFIVTLAYSAICVTCNPPSNPYWILQRQMADPLFYLICIFATVVALLPRYTFHVVRNSIIHSPLTDARHLNQMEPSQRDVWIKEWRSMRGQPRFRRPRLSLQPSSNLDNPMDIFSESITDADTAEDFTLNVTTTMNNQKSVLTSTVIEA